jgi:signal transduction histidine kinase
MAKFAISTILIFLLVFALSAIIFLYSTKIITKPIRLLKDYAEKVARGELDDKIAFTSNDELGLLANSFNKMIRELKKYNEMHLDQIKKLNEELTLKTVEQEASYEELETTNEELITTNEELEIANRDLFNMAQELKKSKEELEKNMAVVKSANEELWILNKIKTNFLGMASHELKKPFVMIKGYAELVLDNKETKLNKTTREMVAHILKGANILNSIIRDMLDITKIEAKDLKLNLMSIELRLLISSAVEEMKAIAKERDQIIKICKVPKTKVLVDAAQIHRVLVHLISNAIKFTPDGGKIEVSADFVKDYVLASMYEEEGIVNAIDIVVSDSGIGIDKKELERIFDVFYEVGDINHHRTSKIAYLGKGSGLGLSICRGIVEAHKGRIWGESEGSDPNEFPGSKFHIVLPLSQKEAAELKKEIEVKEEIKVIPREAPKKKPRILLIEDEKDIVDLTSLILKDKYTLIIANNGVDGIKEAFISKPDVILLDIYMKGLNGFEVCSILKGNEASKNIPIAMFTAGTQKYEIEKGYSMGIDDYITKPFKPRDLLSRIQKLLKSKPG